MKKFQLAFSLIFACFFLSGQHVFQITDLRPGSDDGVSFNGNILTNIVSSVIWIDPNDFGETDKVFFTNGKSYETFNIMEENEDGYRVIDYVVYSDICYLAIRDSDTDFYKLVSVDDDGNVKTILDEWESIDELTVFNEKLYFEGEENIFEEALHSYDPITEETVLHFEVGSFGIRDIEVFKDELYLLARLDNGDNLIKTNGTGSDFTEVFFLTSGSASSSFNNMTATEEKLFFFSADSSSDYGLFSSDGTNEGTFKISGDFSRIPFFDYRDQRAFIGFNNKFYFQGEQDENMLYVTDGTPGNLKEIQIIAGEDSKPDYFTVYNNELYFKAFLGFYFPNQAMYKINSNGLAEQALDHNLVGNDYLLDGRHLTVHDDMLYYASRSNTGNELWKSDGREINTELVFDLSPGDDDSFPSQLTSCAENLFFFATTEESGKELFVYTSNTVSNKNVVEEKISVEILPNPAENYLKVTFSENIKSNNLNIYNANGEKIIMNIKVGNSLSETIDIQKLRPGSYFIISDDFRIRAQFIKSE